jgi:predicted phage terminase large subunit-like protein
VSRPRKRQPEQPAGAQVPTLEPDARDALQVQADLALSRVKLIDFVRRVAGPSYHAGWVHREVCLALERFTADVAAQRSPRLILAMPPRHGKTRIVSQIFPVWYLGHNPGHEIACCSYGQELADDNSRAAREIARDERALDVFPGLTPTQPAKRYYADYRRTDVDKIGMWKVGGGGSYKAVGVGGPLTGRGAHVLIIDDPFKDRQDADSVIKRRGVWSWYTSTAYTRLAPGGGVIVMATRWHEDDLTGKLIRAMTRPPDGGEIGDQWTVINFPAVAEVDEVNAKGRALRRKGDALHPERYPLADLSRIRRSVGSREWASLYQQRPTPNGGNLWRREWFEGGNGHPCRLFRTDPQRMPMDEWALTVDCAFRKKEDSDFVSIQVWGRRGRHEYYLLDQRLERMSYVETKKAVRVMRAKWKQARIVLVEAKANGDALIDDLKDEIPGVIPYDPGNTSKEARAELSAVAYEAGQVWVPDPEVYPWVGDFIDQLVAFPAAPNDDQVDAQAQLINRWQDVSIDPVRDASRQWALWTPGAAPAK